MAFIAIGSSGIAKHLLGGIAGEDVEETTDENPARVALVADAVLSHHLEPSASTTGRGPTSQRK
jgi:hypothetical protein